MEIYKNKRGNILVKISDDESLMLLKKGNTNDYHVEHLDYWAEYKNIVPIEDLGEISKIIKVINTWEIKQNG